MQLKDLCFIRVAAEGKKKDVINYGLIGAVLGIVAVVSLNVWIH